MFMSYGEFMKLTRQEHSLGLFQFWLRSHILPPHLMEAVVAKMRNEV
jgi:hypothetical protein